MGIAKMNKIYLLAHQAEKDRILQVLQQAGVVEISDLTEENAETADWAELVEPDQAREQLQEIENQIAKVRFSLDYLNRYYPEKKGMLDDLLAEKEVVTTEELAAREAEWAQTSAEVYTALKKIDEELLALRNEETRLQNTRQQLLPWQNLPLPLEELRETKAVSVQLGTIPAAVVNEFQKQMQQLEAASFYEIIAQGRDDAYLVVGWHQDDAEAVQDVLKGFSFNRHNLNQFTGTVAENLAECERKATALAKKRAQLLSAIETQLEYRQTLQYYHDILSVRQEQKLAVERLVRTETTFVLAGWLRAADVETLRQKLSAVSKTFALHVREPLPEENFPVVLENKKYFAPFEFVTKLYGMPHPRGIDPTPYFAPFFIIFFGLCLTDAGYGVVISLISALGLLKIKGEAIRKLLKILLVGGISTAAAGWLIGSWFGVSLFGSPLLFDSMTNPMLFLAISFALGLLHIFWGMLIKFVSLWKAGDYFAAIADVGFWYGLIIGLLLLALPQAAQVGKYMALICDIGMVLTQGRHQPSLLKKFTSGLLSLYDITGYLSDLLSYSRLLALGLATGVISMAINTMGGLLKGHPIGFIIMVLFLIGGHIFNLLINALGSFIHSSRLQYIEFYNRFYEGGGRSFMPFRQKTRYLEIRSEK